MLAVDTNVLVHAHREEMPKHGAAHERLRSLAEGRSPWAVPVFCLGEFLRVITHAKVFDPPHTRAEATEAMRRLLVAPTLVVLVPGDAFPALLLEAIEEGEAVGNLVFDAQVVALCREKGVDRLLTEDRDFDRFGGLTIERL